MKKIVIALALAAISVIAEAKVSRVRPAAPKLSSVQRQVQKRIASDYRRSPYVGAISAELKTKKVLFCDRADALAYPASVSKLMTMLLVFEDIQEGRYDLDTEVVATSDVNYSEPSWIGLKAGDCIKVRDLLIALMVESANDAAIALAVNSAGSLDGFVQRMNQCAKDLGMGKTVYNNPNGLPPNPAKRYPWKRQNVSTAEDQLKLAFKLLSHPETTKFTSVKTADLIRTARGYRVSVTRGVGVAATTSKLLPGEKIIKNLVNHNQVMVLDKEKIINPDGGEAIDGLKTGYIDAGGSSVVITGTRNGQRAVAVVLGAINSKERNAAARHLMEDALDAISWK